MHACVMPTGLESQGEIRFVRELLGRWLLTDELPFSTDEALASRLIDTAREQGLAALLHQAIGQRRVCWPHAARATLRGADQEAFAFGLRQLDTVRRVQALLGERGVRCLPLKGSAAAERLYDSVAHRPMADVDLLVLDEWPRAVTMLENAGFVELEQADHARGFLDSTSGTLVELHRGVTSCARLFPLDLEAAWKRGQTGTGLVKWLPSSEDLLVHLALHAAFQHGLTLRLVQWLDFRRLLERELPEPALVASIPTGARAQYAVALALEIARRLVAAPLSPALEGLVDAWLPNRLRRYLTAKLQADPSGFLTPSQPPLGWIRWQVARGRRIALIRETLRPSVCASSRPTATGTVGRALRLVRRWQLQSFRI